MRIAFTGTSSTGKTTLADRIMSDPQYTSWGGTFITANARGLLMELGYKSADDMTVSQRRELQFKYLERKIEREKSETSYFTDRSVIDIAAYWLEYNKLPADQYDEFVSRCRSEVARYDIHLYFPAGLIPIEMDGFRSVDMDSHSRVDGHIQSLLVDWGVRYIPLCEVDIELRTKSFFSIINGRNS